MAFWQLGSVGWIPSKTKKLLECDAGVRSLCTGILNQLVNEASMRPATPNRYSVLISRVEEWL